MAVAHAFPDAQGEQTPPQSRSVSVPFFTPSKHEGSWQMLATHTLLWQSEPAAQPFPTMHLAAHDPPQSTSVSVPFLTVSEHDAGAQRPFMHMPLWQSEPE